ncbi:hypothetical protein [Bacillus sp. AG4(2022)]|uniref:hypothetical protein n=1 Tax=Bacillus sp. AG4(2022) TaxID=2962594 RepID=UPI00288150CA|nr:hypothetical protein [Bacillus sp. AG4(2022)]MDT0163861.1 hypothetical protein [Bacillus sp. AG4(2022)]
MKKIQLSDGMPSSISRAGMKPETLQLLEVIRYRCVESGLSYVEINKALHQADEELYRKVISESSISQESRE